MAQALFDEHPLGEYLRDAGETPFSIPGISVDLEREIDPNYGLEDDASDELETEWRPRLLLDILEVLQSIVSSAQTSHPSSSFIERFKYNVISSSLLAPSLPTPHPGRPSPSRSVTIPGRLNHSRTSSLDDHLANASFTHVPDLNYGAVSLGALATAVLFSIGYPSFALISLISTLYLMYDSFSTTETPKHDMTSSFNALDDLVAANEVWESVVQDCVSSIENEERSTSGSSSSSPLRVALHSCVQITHSQCDNIRHLFSALTCPSELSQLSEMYAPPSPMKGGFTTETNSRPFSYPSSHLSPIKSSYPPTTPENKRSTWNGSYTSLAYAGSPTNSIHRRRDKHRVNISDVFQNGFSSAPVTPLPKTPNSALPEVPEHSVLDEPSTATSSYFSPQASHFGAAALSLHRQRKNGGMDALRSPPPSYFASDLRSPRSGNRNSMFTSTISSASKFTNPQPAKHPLSYTALTYSLQGALSAKRYACSHLLALRFSEEDDEGYWEDVRSVMGLLTSSLVDASSRLAEALEDVEQEKLRDQNPTPNLKAQFDETDIEAEHRGSSHSSQTDDISSRQRRADTGIPLSFAPMPNHISRFAAHIAAISSALDDARENLDQCVSDLKTESASDTSSMSSASSRKLRHVRSFSRMLSSGLGGADAEAEEPRALQAYERLRRELGMALRECERGRERLLEIVYPPPPAPTIPSDDEEEETFDDLPGLGHDASDESDKQDPTSPFSEDEGEVEAVGEVVDAIGSVAHADDASSHLLLTSTTQHLPLPGIEEVFEADTGHKVQFSRERLKMTREERIKIAKARRESRGLGLGVAGVALGVGSEDSDAGTKTGIEKWGPGGEVVQELKDVIWKVGERRRKMTDSVQVQAGVHVLAKVEEGHEQVTSEALMSESS